MPLPSPLPLPDLSPSRVLRVIAGVRPCRRSGPRIAAETVDGKLVIHNYGHGGGGITLGWGSGELAADLVRAHAGPKAPVAVLGAGVMGWSTAAALAAAGHPVRVLAERRPPATTSSVAAAQWSPEYLGALPDGAAVAQLHEALRRSHAWLVARGADWGVHPVPNYIADGVPCGLDGLPEGLLPRPAPVAAERFPGGKASGRVFQSFVVETPVYLPRLLALAEERGVRFEQRRFAHRTEALAVAEPVVVNALGAGARAVFDDVGLVPARGHLVLLAPQPLGYVVVHGGGYVIPRSDALVVGGSFEEGIEDETPDPAIGAAILERNRAFFGVATGA